ncbi:molybdopterin cofactor-binding domain-containing protein [Pelagicoccus sp. SDUM812003]|uniref:xanthine dehydrogenase molybdopterin binding subunit n=1 Tax=Pelagicoccus sp. SDUM812003 TaxID=3041267 RepID=UPI00280DD037|nr:molybdopterin cofactor-binding domain-containing protein [Pelagicoccus sp. SDUM812003]MDQ8205461.1 molybdopterin-dependent oxidoreductase [Pelagicoccus sp. SDUM812003]
MRHCDSELHVTGKSEYVDDVAPPAGMLHAAVFGSPEAHGNLVSIDVSGALKTDGVVSVFTFSDIPGEPYFGPVAQDEPLFADKKVLFQGQPIALVVATSHEAARKGVTRCKADIDALPAITCPRQAFENGEIHQELRTFNKGNVDEIWDRCAHVFEGRIDLAGQEHLYLETNRSRAIPLEDGQLKVFASTQSPSATQKTIASVLGLPMNKVEVDVKRLGGGFGGKEDQATHWAVMASLAAYALKKPVQIVLSRPDDMRMTGKRHPYKQDYKIGLDPEGRILAYEVSHYQNSGAFMDLSNPVLERTCMHSSNAYSIPNIRIRAVPCRTNLPSNTAFRGFGGPQGMFPLEVAIEKAAAGLGVPPDWIQERNLAREGYVFHYGQTLEDDRLKRAWDEAKETFDLASIRERIQTYNQSNPLSKKGFALMPVCFGISFTKTFLNQGSSLVHVYTDGTINVTTGGIEMGQGVSSNMIAICSRVFGVNHKRIRCNSTNTSRIANISPSAASATSDLNGNATIMACEEILTGMKAVAAKELSCEAGQISIVAERVRVDGQETELTWEQLVLKTYFSRVQLMAHGFYTPPNISFDPIAGWGKPFHYYTYGTCLVEATVDCIRGTYTIDSAKLVHDLGRGIIPSVDLGQVEGGLAQGIGWLTLEELVFSDEGKLLSNALSTYKCPDGDALPDDIQVTFLENADNPGGPLGSKAVGEPPFMYGIAAYFAIRRAIEAFAPLEETETRAPMTPEQTLLKLYPNGLSSLMRNSNPSSIS